MLATVVHWTVVFILATRMRLTSECAATSPANTPQGEPPRPTDAQTAAAQTTPSSKSYILHITPLNATFLARPSCGRCQHIPVRMTDNNSRPVQQTDGQGPDGCPIITVNCDGNASDTAVILTVMEHCTSHYRPNYYYYAL